MGFQFVAKCPPRENNPADWDLDILNPDMVTLGDDHQIDEYVDMEIGQTVLKATTLE